MFVMAQVMAQLCIQGALNQFLGQLLEDTVSANQVFRFLVVGQQLVGDGMFRCASWCDSIAHEPITQNFVSPPKRSCNSNRCSRRVSAHCPYSVHASGGIFNYFATRRSCDSNGSIQSKYYAGIAHVAELYSKTQSICRPTPMARSFSLKE